MKIFTEIAGGKIESCGRLSKLALLLEIKGTVGDTLIKFKCFQKSTACLGVNMPLFLMCKQRCRTAANE
jgi:hypothetical protein